MANGGDIIIKGGSVDIRYDDSLYRKEGEWGHINYDKRMTRITVVDDNGKTVYDSDDNDGGLKWEIRAHCK